MHPTPKSRLRSLPSRFVLGGIAAWALAAVSSAQTPSRIIVSKLTTYQQSSAAVVASNGALFTLQVTFPATVLATTLVQLRGPVVLSLSRDSTTIYSFTSATGSEGALDAAIPDGNYTLVVAGNGADTSTAVQVTSRPQIPPPRITNFDDLQALAAGSFGLSWTPVTGGASGDTTSIRISRGLSVIYTSPAIGQPGALNGTSTALAVNNLAIASGETLSVNFLFLRFAISSANANVTTIVAGQEIGRASCRERVLWYV